MRLRLDPFSPNGVSVDNSTITVAGGSSTTGGSSVTVTGEDYLSLAAQEITANPIDLDNLSATGTPSGSTFLRGDNTWATPAGSGDVSKVGTPVNNQVGVWTGDGTIEGDADLTFDTTTDTLATVNIAPSGTVDGRDVATDGTKLDGIEAGADVTDTANVTSAGALMDSEVTNLSQVKAFSSADYATAAQGTTADSAVQPGDLATVATTGAYSDLSGTPTIPTSVDDLNPSQTGNSGKYLKTDGTNATWESVASGGGTVDTVVAGTNIDVDSTDPANPVVSVETLTLADISDVTASATEVNYTTNVTSDIQTQLDGKLDENTPITGATKTKITYDADGLVTSGADATTADIADSSNKRYVTDAQQTVIGNTSGVNTGDQTNISGNAATVTTNANLTGPITSSGNATSIASQTGTGTKFVVDTSPTLVTPTLGVATATSVNKVAITAPATSATLTIADGKTLTASRSLTLTGTDSTTMTFPSTSATIARTDTGQTFTGTHTFNSNIVIGTTVDLSGSVSGTANIVAPTSGGGTLTLPAGTDTLLGKATNDVLTNKNLTSSTNTFPNGFALQVVDSLTTSQTTGTTVIPLDTSIPQSTEGDQYMSATITPKLATSKLVIQITALASMSVNTGNIAMALFQDSTANALAATATYQSVATGPTTLTLTHTMTSGTTSATTFKVRLGPTTASTLTFNGGSGVGASLFGATTKSSIVVTEYKA